MINLFLEKALEVETNLEQQTRSNKDIQQMHLCRIISLLLNVIARAKSNDTLIVIIVFI